MRDLTAQKQHPYTLNELMSLTITQLHFAYVGVTGKDVTWDEFTEQVLLPIPPLDRRDTDQPLEIAMQYAVETEREKGVEFVARSPISAIAVSATYYFRAMWARDNGNLNLAWSYVADARYWCGLANAQKGLEAAFRNAAHEQARLGGQARADRYRPVKDFALHLVRERMPETGWKSRNQAVQKIKEAVLEYAKEKGVSLSESQADRTIDGWLASMDEAKQLFSKK